jgi:hypothetical protein
MYTAIDKFKIIQYFDKHGYQATLDSLLLSGFKVSRRTIFNWKRNILKVMIICMNYLIKVEDQRSIDNQILILVSSVSSNN